MKFKEVIVTFGRGITDSKVTVSGTRIWTPAFYFNGVPAKNHRSRWWMSIRLLWIYLVRILKKISKMGYLK